MVSVSLQRSYLGYLRDAVTRVRGCVRAPLLRSLEQPDASGRLPAWRRIRREPDRRVAATRPAGQIRELDLGNAGHFQRPISPRTRVVASWRVCRLWLIMSTLTHLGGRCLLLAARALTRRLLIDPHSAATISRGTFAATHRRHRRKRSDCADAYHKRHRDHQKPSPIYHLAIPNYGETPSQILSKHYAPPVSKSRSACPPRR